ncbi:MAG: ABC transporter permease, partial [Ignavibacteriales bacterium]
MNLKRIVTIAYKEWREILRDKLFFSLAFIVSIVLMVVFGFGLSLDVENIPFAVVDYDHSAMSRDYAYRFINSRYFDFKGYSSSERELDLLLSNNNIRATIIIPERFQENLLAGRPVHVQTLIDGSFPSRALTTKVQSVMFTQSLKRVVASERISVVHRPLPGMLPYMCHQFIGTY